MPDSKEKLRAFLKNKENLLLILLISFSIIYRLFYFFKLGEQPIWWDEGDYLSVSKIWALGMERPEWWGHVTGMRPLLMPIIWFIFFKLHLGELSIRFFTLLIPSLISIYLVYAIGKELYNKKVGLVAGFMFSVYWVFTFYTYRILTDIPATMFALFSIFFFYKDYIKHGKQIGLYLCLLFGVLAFSARFPLAMVLVTCFIFLFFLKKFSILKEKSFWKGILVLLVLASPFIIYMTMTKFYFIQFYFINGIGGLIKTNQSFGFYLFPLSLSILKTFWIIAFIIGIFTFFDLVVGFDIFWKQKNNSLNADFFILLLIVLQYIFYVFIFRGANDRWILILTIAMMFIASKGLVLVYDFVKKYNKIIAMILVAIILFGGAYQNIAHANQLIDVKKDSYGEIKKAGLWLKENTPEDAKIVTASVVQNQYYSERRSYGIYGNGSGFEGCYDIYGNLVTNESCQKGTEEAFNVKINELKPDYLIVSVFEPVFTPQWAYNYPQKYNLTFVNAYVNNQNQLMLAIYKF